MRRADMELAIEMAPRMREAGIRRARFGDVELQLDAPEAPYVEDREERAPPPADPLDDPITYGRSDGYVPGFERLREAHDE